MMINWDEERWRKKERKQEGGEKREFKRENIGNSLVFTIHIQMEGAAYDAYIRQCQVWNGEI